MVSKTGGLTIELLFKSKPKKTPGVYALAVSRPGAGTCGVEASATHQDQRWHAGLGARHDSSCFLAGHKHFLCWDATLKLTFELQNHTSHIVTHPEFKRVHLAVRSRRPGASFAAGVAHSGATCQDHLAKSRVWLLA